MHQPPVRFTYRLLSYLISTIIAGQPLLPAVGAVITPQNGAGMDKAANGVPVVNIATPNGAGISHNRFTDYNVGKEGLILNNATGKLNPTQLGGLIQNNPNLKAGGEAKGIINEVTGGNRSLLQGYTEVAGKAANVMVANPYGITCDGCGFINTPHATLTTGKPVMNADGSLQALEVTEGSITINGAGLDGTRSDAVSIIARATEVNAALHAKDLTVTAGANRITADGRVSALKGEGDVPKVAVDTGALGGMYARRIHLTSTESGVGVNLGNLYAREGDIILNSAGKLVLKNSLAGGNTTVTGTNVSLSGDNKAGGNLSVTGTTGLTLNQSRLVTDKNLVLSSSGQIVQNGGELTAGQNAMLSAQHLNQTSGTVNAAENVTLTTTDDTTLKGRSVAGKTLTVSSGSLNNGGRVLATGSADVKGTTLNNTGTLQGAELLVNYHTFSNSGTLLGTSGLGVKGSSLLQNGTGRLYSAGNLLLDAQDFSGQGQVVATGDVTLKLIAALTNHGTLAAGKTLSVTSQNAITNGGVMQGDAMVLGAGEAFTNNGTLTAGKGNSVFSAQRLFLNAPGSLQAGGDVSLNSRSDITISGFTGTAGSLTMNVAGTLLNSALIYAGNNLKLFTDRLHNQHGDILAGNSLWVQKDASGGANTEIINTSGNIETHQGDIVVRTGHLLNQREGFSATTTTRTNPSSIQGMGNALVDIPLSLLPDGSYGYFTREVENQHGTPCNGHGACNITMDTLGPGTSDAFLSMSSPFPAGATFGNHDPRYGGKGDFFNQKVELTPADIEFVKKITGLPVIVKGILRGEDAVVAIDAGADAIQVSNHGGRQIDGVPSAISQLQEVAARVGHKVPVIFDSGIRRGIDVVRAISLGATAVAVGRPVLYGIAAGGVGGVAGVIEHLKTELRTAMLLSGARTLKDLAQGFIRNKETEH
ncbi:filamentous hemagglutinin N-terminal domain-containing protein [Escherichia coli]|nr:filamentous hemagglutinin N-terminal domain-containing protein [Escherichia coli]HCL6422549.1 alpha-hydroxy-acid oxidizing protein [Escherichia coli]